ncbi:hypothetical protein [Actinomycetospora aeridis]|uniref:Uncharacterized protein n=1 Tax=Actinomycetospora aeridis TaxID=3129231 RepID=A0ABU8NEH4_9PSEU
MGRRKHDGQRRAAKVAARRLRRTRPPHTRATRGAESRVAAPLLSDCELLEQFPDAFADDLDDDEDELREWDDWEDLDDLQDLEDDEPDMIDLLEDDIRGVVLTTVVQRDPEVARAFVDGRDRQLIDIFVGAWLAKARRRFPDPELSARAAAWVAESLGERGPAVAHAARTLGPDAAVVLREHFLRVPDDIAVARIWMLSAVVVVGGAGGVQWLDDPDQAGRGSGRRSSRLT